MRRRRLVALWSLLLLGMLALPVWWAGGARAQEVRASWGATEGQTCLQCHSSQNVALVEEWRLGAHGQKRVNCFDCHRAAKGEPDAFDHYGNLIAVIVSPKDCARCHQREVDEQKGSHHAKAGQILASLDNFLGEVVGGPPAV
ncbi:MAG: cytochrome C552, partial [candidate division NC10 bacterium]|nr:cytochrome C552 [candidate division NC10 bacterium]